MSHSHNHYQIGHGDDSTHHRCRVDIVDALHDGAAWREAQLAFHIVHPLVGACKRFKHQGGTRASAEGHVSSYHL